MERDDSDQNMTDKSILTVHLARETRRLTVDPQRASVVLSGLLRGADLALNTRCGQRSLCDGCVVELLRGSLIHATSGERLDACNSADMIRACEYRLPPAANAEIRIPGRSLLAHEPQVVTSFRINVSRAYDPLWQRLSLAPNELDPGLPIDQAVCRAVTRRRDGDLPLLADPQMQAVVNRPNAEIPIVLEHQGDHWLVQPAELDACLPPYGVAVDIGTTTVAVLLVDLETGDIVDTASALNGQTRLGDNVLTRIQLCLNNKDMIARLQQAVVSKTLRPLIDQLLTENGVHPRQLNSIVVAANTTMLHLLVAVDPGSMGTAPFTPQFLEHRVLRSRDIPLRLERIAAASRASGDSPSEADADEPDATPDPALHLLPGAAAYVGADIMAGVFSSGMVYSDETCLLVDVGTNGEIVLKHEEHLFGCATAAGPAFEGSGLNCGVRAGRGAISHIRFEAGSTEIGLDVIGDAEPIGLCGTAYVDFVAQAHRVGLIGPTGRFTADAVDSHPAVRAGQHSRKFIVATGRDGEEIFISEVDIASLLQAKAAIAAGIVCLLQRVGLDSQAVRTLYLAGGFGFHMDIDSVLRCGLLPGFRPEQISMVGNTSLAGAYLALVDSSALAEIKLISARVETIELNLDPDFESVYIDQLTIPGSS